jgi:hypothetical protein
MVLWIIEQQQFFYIFDKLDYYFKKAVVPTQTFLQSLYDWRTTTTIPRQVIIDRV